MTSLPFPFVGDTGNLFSSTEKLDIRQLCSMEELRFLDIESSGLHVGSFPVEYASCDLNFNSSSFLIKPLSVYDAKMNWSLAAQNLHGLSIEELEDSGFEASNAAEQIARDLVLAPIILSDNPDHDTVWLSKLDGRLGQLAIMPVNLFLPKLQEDALVRHGFDALSMAVQRVMDLYPHMHRALPDVLRLTAMFRILVDDDYFRMILRT